MPPDDPALRATLDDYLAVDVPTEPAPEGGWPDPAEAPPAPAPDEDFANRLLYKGRKLTEERAKIAEMANAERSRVALWEADMTSGIARELKRLAQSLEGFLRNWHRDHPRTKTLKLANGTLSLKQAAGKVIVTDEHAFIAWAKTHRPDLLRQEPAIAKAKLADEMVVSRHAGPQQNVAALDDALADTWRLMAEIDVQDEQTGEVRKESVSLPGVMWAKPVVDTFHLTLPKPTTNNEGEQ
ncbi:MAG: host-nuclease inhibitor Gam family protein [Rhodospirillales bacterium]|nr:host-nuclease inhibitor Gam family protein [Rhodospirillales bacterium]